MREPKLLKPFTFKEILTAKSLCNRWYNVIFLCSTGSSHDDWQRDGLLDNCGDDEAAASEVDAHHSDQQQPRPWWQLSSANSLWKQRLRQSIETLRHFSCQHPPEYSINEGGGSGGGHQGRGRQHMVFVQNSSFLQQIRVIR